MKLLSLLNVKYLIKNSEDNPLGVTRNPNTFGNAWFIKNTLVVDNADQELILLDSVDLSSTCLTQNSKLSNLKFTLNSKDLIKLVSRKANELIYKSSTSSKQFAVFSEAYYKNVWPAFIDGKEVNHFKVNYLLRGMFIPEGDHEIVFKFNPQVIKTGTYISLFSYILLMQSHR